MDFDVVIIGGGHAGAEAAHASARLGCRTALLTLDVSRIGVMSCNPAIGGLAKGQLVKEIDALGGIMGINTDRTAIQYRRLNASKGPAVRSSRAQCDKDLYAKGIQKILGEVSGLTIVPLEAAEIRTEGGRACAVVTTDGTVISCRAAVVTAGTFLRGVMFTGFDKSEGGRVGERAANAISSNLEKLGFKLGRLKTGTPPRININSINISALEPQPGDAIPVPFSFYGRPNPFPALRQVNCFITYTNTQVHEMISEAFDRSPMYTGMIKGLGPRYCPSIEDKVKRFSHRDRHQVFLEPEGLGTDSVYVNGISTSLPKDVQERFVRAIPGLECAEFLQYGYAVEYDCIDARVLRSTFESKDIPGLFFAGQINGTSGYEEAAAQGLVAGLNAALQVLGRDSFTLSREEGYIGVLVDDLVTKGADEPYRMFTSRAEYRLLLREDNADLRLSEKGHIAGLLSGNHFDLLQRKIEEIERFKGELSRYFVLPSAEANAWFEARGLRPLKDRVAADVLLRRPEINWASVCELGFNGSDASADVQEQVEIQIKYEGYIRRELELLEGVRKNGEMRIPTGIDFRNVPGLSNEVKGRLLQTRPETIGQVSRMQGITPAAVANLMVFLKMNGAGKQVGTEGATS